MLLHAFRYPPAIVKGAIEEARNTGGDLPPYVLNAPRLRIGLELYLNAWFELDNERRRVKLDPIKRSSVWEYCRDYDLDEVQSEDLYFYVGRMDNEFLNWFGETYLKVPTDGGPSGVRS